jgi:hypothetical protein
MPSEKTLNLPLSGAEVLTAILSQIETRLKRDCYLSPTSAYEYYTAEVHIKLRLQDVGRTAEVDQTVVSTIGQPPENEDEFLDIAEAQFQVEAAPPNEIREETGQPIPVLTSKNGKEEIKSVRYATKGKGKK